MLGAKQPLGLGGALPPRRKPAQTTSSQARENSAAAAATLPQPSSTHAQSVQFRQDEADKRQQPGVEAVAQNIPSLPALNVHTTAVTSAAPPAIGGNLGSATAGAGAAAATADDKPPSPKTTRKNPQRVGRPQTGPGPETPSVTNDTTEEAGNNNLARRGSGSGSGGASGSKQQKTAAAGEKSRKRPAASSRPSSGQKQAPAPKKAKRNGGGGGAQTTAKPGAATGGSSSKSRPKSRPTATKNTITATEETDIPVDDLLNKVIQVPAHVFDVHVPNLFYLGDITRPDPRRRNAVELVFRDDNSMYWFPAADVRAWLADMERRRIRQSDFLPKERHHQQQQQQQHGADSSTRAERRQAGGNRQRNNAKNNLRSMDSDAEQQMAAEVLAQISGLSGDGGVAKQADSDGVAMPLQKNGGGTGGGGRRSSGGGGSTKASSRFKPT